MGRGMGKRDGRRDEVRRRGEGWGGEKGREAGWGLYIAVIMFRLMKSPW